MATTTEPETLRALLRPGLLAAAAMEAVTLVARFGLKLESTRDTASLARFTFGFRIHHGYIGLLLLLAFPWVPPGRARWWAGVLGIGLLVSDLVHHFVVLWPLTGDPQFHIKYAGY